MLCGAAEIETVTEVSRGVCGAELDISDESSEEGGRTGDGGRNVAVCRLP